jgi:tubulin-specific chaperone C
MPYLSKPISNLIDLLDMLSKDAPNLDTISVSALSLRKSLQDNLDNLPAHDRRIYEQDLQQVEKRIDTLRKASSSKSKFSFSRSSMKIKSSTPLQTDANPKPISATAPTFDPSTLNLISLSSQVITTESLGDRISQISSLTISDALETLIDLRRIPSLLACHAKNISDSVIILPAITGSVILDAISNCLVVVQCQQVS